ncbi:MAG: hypothetical protein O3A80_03565 [bacterium]|nr:hypothetical protein [bacterium]
MGRKNAEHQLLMNFTYEPVHHTHLQKPPYFREKSPDDPDDEFPSPREAFQTLVNPLLQQGLSEEQIHPKLHAFMKKQRWFLGQILLRLPIVKGVEKIQRDNASVFHAILNDLTELECAWHTFELDISAQADNMHLPLHSRNFAKWFRGRMGQFRREMPDIYKNLYTCNHQ